MNVFLIAIQVLPDSKVDSASAHPYHLSHYVYHPSVDAECSDMEKPLKREVLSTFLSIISVLPLTYEDSNSIE